MKESYRMTHTLLKKFAFTFTVSISSLIMTAGVARADSTSATTAPATKSYFGAYGNHGGVSVTTTQEGEAITKLTIKLSSSPYIEQYELDLLSNVIVKQTIRGTVVESATTAASGDAAFGDMIARARDLVLYTLAPERFLWLPYFGKKSLNPDLSAMAAHLGDMLLAMGRDLKACELFESPGLKGSNIESHGGLSTGDLRSAGHHVASVWVRDGYKLVLLDKPDFVTDGAKIVTLDALIDHGQRSGSGVAYELAPLNFIDKTASFVCMKKL